MRTDTQAFNIGVTDEKLYAMTFKDKDEAVWAKKSIEAHSPDKVLRVTRRYWLFGDWIIKNKDGWYLISFNVPPFIVYQPRPSKER